MPLNIKLATLFAQCFDDFAHTAPNKKETALQQRRWSSDAFNKKSSSIVCWMPLRICTIKAEMKAH